MPTRTRTAKPKTQRMAVLVDAVLTSTLTTIPTAKKPLPRQAVGLILTDCAGGFQRPGRFLVLSVAQTKLNKAGGKQRTGARNKALCSAT